MAPGAWLSISAAGRIYWANQGNATISYANLDGSGGGGQLNISGTTPNKPHGVGGRPHGGEDLLGQRRNDTISYANLDGSGGDQLDIYRGDPGRPLRRGDRPRGGEDLLGRPAREHDLLRQPRRIGRRRRARHLRFDPGGHTRRGDRPPRGEDLLGQRPPVRRLHTISFANLDGSGGGGELNLTGSTPSGAVGLAIDHEANRLYFGNLGNDTISYVNLDGSGGGGQLNLTGATSSDPRFLALLRSPSGAGVPQIAGGSSAGSALTCSQGAWAPDQLGAFLYRAPQSFAYQWSRDGAEIGGATDPSYTANVPGDYRCRVTATNEAGSTSQTSDTHTVPAPSATISDGPKDKTKKKKATFEFTGGEAAARGFQCSLDGAPFVACARLTRSRSRRASTSSRLRRSIRPATSSSPATDDWKVKKREK